MERWNIWKKGEALYPSYLLANQAAVRRNVVLRRLLILSQAQMQDPSLVADAIQIMDDQHRAGIKIYYAFREELSRSPAFHRLEQDFKKYGAAEEINSAMFDEEILIFSQSYAQVPLGMVGKPTQITMIKQLQITWEPEVIRELNPASLFDMTKYVFEYEGAKPFHAQLARFNSTIREGSL